MSVKITLEFGTTAEAIAALNKLGGDGPKSQPDSAKSSKSTAKSETQPAPSQPTAQAGVAAAPAEKVRSYNDTGLGKLINDCVKAGKLDAAKKILSDFGVAKGPELKPEQFDDAIAKFTALLKDPTADLG